MMTVGGRVVVDITRNPGGWIMQTPAQFFNVPYTQWHRKIAGGTSLQNPGIYLERGYSLSDPGGLFNPKSHDIVL